MNNRPDRAGDLISIWIEEYKIHSENIDICGKLKFYSLCGYFFEVASRHANHLHFGYKDLEQDNYYWVLSRLHVKVVTYPEFEQKIILETWHKGLNKLFGIRDFRIFDIHEKVLALATSAWLVLDKSSGRPVKPDRFKELLRTQTDHHAINEIPDRIEPLEENNKIKTCIIPGYSDLDINYHVNAGRYIAWIQDLYLPDFYEKNQISEFQINYLSETKHDDMIRILAREESSDNHILSRIEGRIAATDNPAFRAIIRWNRK